MQLAMKFIEQSFPIEKLFSGSEITPRLLSGRCLFLVLLFTSLTLYTYYTSVFVSTLVKAGSKNKIKSVTDLAKSQLKISFEDIPYIHGFLNVSSFDQFDIFHLKKICIFSQSTQDPEFKFFIAKKVKLNDDLNFLNSHEGLNNVQRQRYAFHCEANTAFPIIASTFTQSQICDLNVIPFRREKMQGFIIRKNSPFHDIFAIK